MKANTLDTVVLQRDLPEHGLRRGDLGAVVQVFEPAKAATKGQAYRGEGATETIGRTTVAFGRFVALFGSLPDSILQP